MFDVFATTETRLLFGCIACISLGIVLTGWFRRERYRFWAPPTFVSAIYIYYAVIGPLVLAWRTGFMDRNVDMAVHMLNAWRGGLVALISWLAGYAIRRWWTSHRRIPARMITVGNAELLRLAVCINIVGLVGFVTTTGMDIVRVINPLVWSQTDGSQYSGYSGVFFNYFGLAVNMLIPGSCMLLLLCLRRYMNWTVFAIWMSAATSIFIFMGFRYRLVLLYGSATFSYYLFRRQRPSMLLTLACGVIFLSLMGFIGETRRYGAGLDISQRSGSWSDAISSAFAETSIFATSGAVLSIVPVMRPHTGFEPIKQTLLMPLPSQIYKSKDTMAYTRETLMVIYGETHYEGGAYMSFAEAYLAYGWPGLIVFHVVLGFMCHWLWVWYSIRAADPLAVLVYAAAVPYLYVVYSRGYLPQVVVLFFFTVMPAIVLYRWPKRLALWAPSFGLKKMRDRGERPPPAPMPHRPVRLRQ